MGLETDLQAPLLTLLTGIADLGKFALIAFKALFTVFGMPFISAHSCTESAAVLATRFSVASLLI